MKIYQNSPPAFANRGHTNPYLSDQCFHHLFLPSFDPLARIGVRDDKRERDLSAVFVRYSDDANVGHERVVEEVALELCRSDLKTTDFHDFLEAVDDENIIVGVDDSFVTGADPSRNPCS